MADSNIVNETLKHARALIENGWCKNNYAEDANGKKVEPFSESAVRFCAYGAIERAAHSLCYPDLEIEVSVRKEAHKRLKSVIPFPYSSIPGFNDNQSDVQPVLFVFDKAIH